MVTKEKYSDRLTPDKEPESTHGHTQLMEHNTVKYDKSVATEIIADNEDNCTTRELDTLTTITDRYEKVEESTENHSETNPDTQAILDAETSEEATTDDHIHATNITNEKTPDFEMTEDKYILYISTLKDDMTVIGTTSINSQENDIIEIFYKDTVESKEMDTFSQSSKIVELDLSLIVKIPVTDSLVKINSSSPTSYLSNSHHMQVIVLLPVGFLVLIVLAFFLCAFLFKTRKRKFRREKIDVLGAVTFKDYKQVAKN